MIIIVLSFTAYVYTERTDFAKIIFKNLAR